MAEYTLEEKKRAILTAIHKNDVTTIMDILTRHPEALIDKEVAEKVMFFLSYFDPHIFIFK